MPRPEGATTVLLRDTMNLELDGVNAKLRDAGEPALTSETLRKRRNAIRLKDSLSGKPKVKSKSVSKPKAKRKTATKPKRKSPAPPTEPRKNTFSGLVYRLPYDMEPNEVMKRAKSAGLKGSLSFISKVRSKYPKKDPKLNEMATPTELKVQDARERQAPITVVTRENVQVMRTQLTMLILQLGTVEAEAVFSNCRALHSHLAVSLNQTTPRT